MASILHTKEQGLRLQKLANLGGLVAIAGLEDVDPAVLLGALIELTHRLPELSIQRLEMLRAAGMQQLQTRNAVKRAYKTQPEKPSMSTGSPTSISLNKADIKRLLMKLNGRTPLLEKDWIPELIRIIRGN